MGRHHHHPDEGKSSRRNLGVAFWLNTGFALLELGGGFYTNSVAILSDALHDFGDSLSLGLSYYFQKKSARARDSSYSYGYKRFSLLGAVINGMILITGSVFILEESIRRLSDPQQADARGMFVFALIGVAVNAFAMLRLRKGTSINERVVSLHFLEDVLGWMAVLVASVVMMFAAVPWLDPVLSICIAAFILYNAFRNLRDALRIILQGIPENVDVGSITARILSIPGVLGVHDLHTWTMDGRYNIMTVHVTLEPTTFEKSNDLKQEIRRRLGGMNVQHLTIETELEGDPCAFRDC